MDVNKASESRTSVSNIYAQVQVRSILAAMGFWSLFILSSLRLNVSLAIVSMVNWRAIQGDYLKNYSNCLYRNIQDDELEVGEFMWSPKLQGHILSSYFYGVAAMQLPGSQLSETFSAKLVLLFGTMIATFCTFLCPVASRWSPYGLIFLQVIKGCGQGIVMPAFHVLLKRWIPIKERHRFLAYMNCGIPIGGFVTLILSGVICNSPSLGWPYAFYIFGILGVLWCIFWIILIYDDPHIHPYIGPIEKRRVIAMHSKISPVDSPMPIKSILTSPPVWTYISLGFTSSWIFILYMTMLPIFMKSILHYNVKNNGMLSSLSHLMQAFLILITSFVTDRAMAKTISKRSTVQSLEIFSGFIAFAICMICLPAVRCETHLIVLLIIIALGVTGVICTPIFILPLEMSPKYAGTLTAIMNIFGAIPGVIIPNLLGYLTEKEQTMNEWQVIFYLSSALSIGVLVVYFIFGSNEVQPWDKSSR